MKNTEQVKTFETVLVAFDGQGKLLWDQSVKLDDIEKPAVEQVADFYSTDSITTIVYKKESDIKVKRINRQSQKVSESTHKITLMSPIDEVRHEDENEGGVAHWIGNHFYVWGYQTIRDASKRNDKTRHVFYINKVVVD
jgi:hypothetical protein